MSDPNQSGDVFGAASRASDYIEEDTVGVERQGRRSAPEVDEATGLRPIPPMPASPTQPEEPVELAPSLAVVSEVPESVKSEDQPPAERRPLDREASASVLFGGAAPVAPVAATGKATKGFRGALASIGLPIKPSAAEAAELAEANEMELRRSQNETVIRQATWTRAVSILVNNPKGGTGKTPTALLLGGVIASIRGGSTAIVEFSDDPGALNYRAEGSPRLGLGELVRDVSSIKTAGQLHGYTAPQTSFANVIASTGRRDRLDGDAVVAVSTVIDEFYGIRVMDTGNQPTSSAFRGAVSVADVLVIPVLNAGDSVLEAIQLLDELRDAGGQPAELADRAIAIRLTDGRPESESVREEVTRLLHDAGVRSLHEIPYDEHIAARGQLTLGSLNPATRDAFAAAAAAVVRTLQETVAPASTPNRKA
jgi:MinD-like ATPase involved in chromosome partitioning or flagellar assembly